MRAVIHHPLNKIPSLYCATGENAVRTEDSLFLTLPDDFAAEARALGAQTRATASGFWEVIPQITAPEQLRDIPYLPDKPVIRDLLAEIERRSEAHNVLLNVSAPYSLLAQISSPKLPAWLLRRPDAVHAALGSLTGALADYIGKAFDRGVKVVSMADPHAQRELLGEKCYKEFAAQYQLRLLERLVQSPSHGVVHLCPFSFTPLEEYGLLALSDLTPAESSYEKVLLNVANSANSVVLIGHQCPHTRFIGHLYQLALTQPFKERFPKAL